MQKKGEKTPGINRELHDAPVPKVFVNDVCDRPISNVYTVIDTDLARDNLENHMTAADLQDL